MEDQLLNKPKLEDVKDDSEVTVMAKDLKIVLSILNAGASRGLFKPEEFSLLGELNDNVKKSLVAALDKN